MATKRFSEEEKRRLRKDVKNKIERMEQQLQNDNEVQIVDAFKNRFNVCESAYKVILAKHQTYKGNQSTKSLKIDMRQVPYAMSFAGYIFDTQLLEDLFGSSCTPKGKTAKMLRNATTHGMDNSAVEEIIDRKEELFGYMDKFLNILKSWDDKAA